MKLTLIVYGLAAICFLRIDFISGGSFNPYSVLGVHRRASQTDVKKAYKNLAKRWHPDKVGISDKSEAEEKFIQINQAYELLSDPERRRQYDNYGITEDSPNFNGRSKKAETYASYERFQDPFNDFFGGGGGKFRFHFGSSFGEDPANEGRKIYHQQSITSKAYYNTVLPQSRNQPYLILFYSDWCFNCLRIAPIWARLSEELEPVGFGVATVHTEHEKELARKVSVKEVPHMILLLDSKIYHYKDPQFSAVKAIEFIRRKLPYKLVHMVDNTNVDLFLNGWMDNKIRILLFGKIDVVRLRYLTTAFKYRERALLGFVNTRTPSGKDVERRFGLTTGVGGKDSLLLFHENPSLPVASLTMKDIPVSSLSEVIESNLFLQLPRLSSQSVLDALCPPEASRTRKHLCVILVNDDDGDLGGAEEERRQALRGFISRYKFSVERVRFAYILRDKQTDFVKALTEDDDNAAAVSHDGLESNLAIVWRRNETSLSYEWFPDKWEHTSGGDKGIKLKKMLQKLVRSGQVLSHDTYIKQLVDEHAQTIFTRIANKMLEIVESLRENVTKDEVLPALSLVATVAFIAVGGYIMSYLVKMEEESVRQKLGAQGLKVDKKGKVVPELKIHELRAETYNGMVRLLKPGCRTLVLILDKESKEKLVPQFYKLAWPYRRNKTLMFGFLYIEKGLPWFKKILNLTLPEPRDININPKNCIGTVLSLNGHRRYFCMYHAKHPEGSRRKVYTANNGAAAGAFMGFDSDVEESGSEGDHHPDVERGSVKRSALPLLDSPDHLPIFEDQLLDGLQMWMDRLFEGSTYRYHVNYWPEFPISPANFSASKTSS